MGFMCVPGSAGILRVHSARIKRIAMQFDGCLMMMMMMVMVGRGKNDVQEFPDDVGNLLSAEKIL